MTKSADDSACVNKMPTILLQTMSPRIAGLCGMLGPVVGVIFMGLAIFHASSWFSWTDNWISDMGGSDGERPVWSARGTESVLLNVGLVVTGALGTVFALGVGKIRVLDTEPGRRGARLLLADMVALALVGVFPMSLEPLHYAVSLTFFLLLPVSMLVIGKILRESPEKGPGRFATMLGVSTLCLAPLLAIPRPWGGNAVAEMFPATAFGIFSLVFGIHLWRGRFEASGSDASGPERLEQEPVKQNA